MSAEVEAVGECSTCDRHCVRVDGRWWHSLEGLPADYVATLPADYVPHAPVVADPDRFTVTVEWVWHRHNRPRIAVDTPPHVHAHIEGDDVEHVHPGLGNVWMIGR